MISFKKLLLTLLLGFYFTAGFSQSTDLFQTILTQDSIFFEAYNTCNLIKQAEFYSDSIEFYHDQGGLINSKKQLLEGTEKYICGKVTRTLVKGSVEVSPIAGFGAVEIGMHTFYNKEQKQQSSPSKFVIVWKRNDNNWKITRVISLH